MSVKFTFLLLKGSFAYIALIYGHGSYECGSKFEPLDFYHHSLKEQHQSD